MPGKKPKKDVQVAKDVMAELKKRNVRMRRPSWFVAVAVATGIALAMSLLSTIYLIGFLILDIRNRAVFEYLGFGPSGVGHFILTFPWFWLILASISIFLSWFLLRRYDFSYKSTHYGLLVAAVAVLVMIGAGLALEDAHLPGRPVAPDFIYSNSTQPQAGKIAGTVTAVGTNSLTIGVDDQSVTVLTDSQTLGLAVGGIAVGEKVIILGDWVGNSFHARAIRDLGPALKHQHEIFEPSAL